MTPNTKIISTRKIRVIYYNILFKFYFSQCYIFFSSAPVVSPQAQSRLSECIHRLTIVARKLFYTFVWMFECCVFGVRAMCATQTVPCRRPIYGCCFLFDMQSTTQPVYFVTCLRDIHNNEQLKWERNSWKKRKKKQKKNTHTIYRKIKSGFRKYVFTKYSPLWINISKEKTTKEKKKL